MEITNSIKWLIVIAVLLTVHSVVVAFNPINPLEKPGLQGMLADSYKAKQKAEIEKIVLQVAGITEVLDVNNLPSTGNPAADVSLYVERLKTFQNKSRRINFSRCPADFRKVLKDIFQLFDKITKCAEEMKMVVDEVMTTSDMQARLALQSKVLKIQNDLTPIMADMNRLVVRITEINKLYGIDDKELMERYLAEKEQKGETVKSDNLFSVTTASSVSSPTDKKNIELIGYMQPVYDGVCLRLAKLIEMAGETNKMPEQLKTGAEKTKEFAANYQGSSFPKDFLSVLKRVEEQMETYANWQTELQNEEDDNFRNEIDKAHLDEMKQLIRDLNKVASKYGCEISPAP